MESKGETTTSTTTTSTKEVIHPEKVSQKTIPKKKIKCHQCNKKLMLMQQIICQCNYYFCPCHMNRHSHNCSFNSKDSIKEKLKENNPLMCEKMKDKI